MLNTNNISDEDEDIDIDEGIQNQIQKVSIMDQMKVKFKKLEVWKLIICYKNM